MDTITIFNLSDLGMWYIGCIYVLLAVTCFLTIIQVLHIGYYTMRYWNVSKIKEKIENHLLFNLIDKIINIVILFEIVIVIPLIAWFGFRILS